MTEEPTVVPDSAARPFASAAHRRLAVIALAAAAVGAVVGQLLALLFAVIPSAHAWLRAAFGALIAGLKLPAA